MSQFKMPAENPFPSLSSWAFSNLIIQNIFAYFISVVWNEITGLEFDTNTM